MLIYVITCNVDTNLGPTYLEIAAEAGMDDESFSLRINAKHLLSFRIVTAGSGRYNYESPSWVSVGAISFLWDLYSKPINYYHYLR